MINQVVELPYGKTKVIFEMNPSIANWDVLESKNKDEISPYNEKIVEILQNPVKSVSLSKLAKPSEKIVIVTSDGTRPVPHKDIIPPIIEQLNVPLENITIIIGTGSHRGNTQEELVEMLGADLVAKVEVVNHNSFSDDELLNLGKTKVGGPVIMNRLYVEADKRIVVGFIEPHGFAGFSGGPKGVVPGVAGIETIKYIHSYEMINSPLRGWAKTENNPIRNQIYEMVSFCPPDFLVNVTLNKNKRITNVFAGEYVAAHKQGCDYVQQHSMIRVEKKYPVVIVTNNGFPLDQNLYQSVKGLMAANEIVTDDGIIIIFAECLDGIPSHGNFEDFVKNKTPVQILKELARRTVTESDQWEAQVWAEVFKNRKIYIYSSLPDSVAKSFNLQPLHNYQKEINNILEQLKFTDVAVLPEGPVAIPYFK